MKNYVTLTSALKYRVPQFLYLGHLIAVEGRPSKIPKASIILKRSLVMIYDISVILSHKK